MEENRFLDLFLLKNVKEEQLLNKIKLMANPILPDDIKKDLSTFFFVWNAIKMNLIQEYIVSIIFVVHKIANEGRNRFIDFPVYPDVFQYKNFIKKYLLKFKASQRLLVLRELGLLRIHK